MNHFKRHNRPPFITGMMVWFYDRTPAVGAVAKFGRGITGVMGVECYPEFRRERLTAWRVFRDRSGSATDRAASLPGRSPQSRFGAPPPGCLSCWEECFQPCPPGRPREIQVPCFGEQSSSGHHPGYRSLPRLERSRCIRGTTGCC